MLGLKSAGKGLIGVDITSATVKLLELSRHGNRYQIDSYAVRPLKEGAVVERRIRDMDEVVLAIKRAVEQAQPRSRRAVVAVPASAAITKTLSFPTNLADDEIEQRIALESEKHFPFPLNDVAFDFQHLGVNARNPDQQDLLLVACRSLDVDQLTSALEQAGLEPSAVDVETFSLERAFGELRHQLPPTYDNEECVAVVDIGATMTAFHVIQNGRIVYSRDAVFGGRQLTDEIMNRFDLSNDEAGLAKKRGGLPDTYDSEVLDPFRDTLVQQIARSLQLYYTAGKRREVQRILLGGGTAAIPGLRESLAGHTGLEVIMANPFTHMSVNPRVDIQALAGDAPAMLTACGLAMRKRS
ncbi:pilus assembly protein PilM [Cobetia marina]|uniref:Type IV pilus assembly protein PilM n=1 Tax=Cobetia marina TaxID=28258 RepID=A0ABU9GFI9_COBMA|nr:MULTISPECIES: type IV pilus assembly protein PilM [Cobetia]AZV30393.1 pilus assembly protein PilM [Cobetia sp. ICG0124]MDA5564882.1 type IV pilus assembly protein PilM [Cobetia sp. MMG027]MDH2292205.1 type IV pilus assembly protein PilM [Cobetia sp. 10Alg 146]MDH2374527.1 type IV pilus assembly protein PilM [Cobetia sp. 3AK]MDI6004782.1 type IV pilus assembly protein PilM [Cobetia pacifica]